MLGKRYEGHPSIVAGSGAQQTAGAVKQRIQKRVEDRMNYDALPQHVLAKLLALDEAVAALKAGADAVERGIEDRRARLWGNARRADDNPRVLQAELEKFLADQKGVQQRLQAEQAVLSACKLWLDRLPAGTQLELVPVTADGHELAEIRKRVKAAIAEVDALKHAPAPSGDIEARVRNYIGGLAPKVRGVGVGERLSIIFPGAQSSSGSGYISGHTCDPLALLAVLFPERMLALVMGEVERMANDPCPVAQRPPRVAALESELDELHRVEEVLVAAAIAAGEPVHRSPSAPPPAVLCVKIADKVSRAA
jgi:hypothetical protein